MMKKIIIGMLFILLPFTHVSSAMAGTCPFGGSPNWKGVCDTTTDSGQSYFGPTLPQQQADQIGPAPLPSPTPTPPPAPETPSTPTPSPVPAEVLLMLALGILSQNNALLIQNSAVLNMLSQQGAPSPSPSPTSSPSPSPTPTQDSEPGSPSPTQPSPSPSSETQNEAFGNESQISQRSISVKPVVVDNSLVINRKINENVFNNKVVIVATKGKNKKTWTQRVNRNVVNIKIPKKYLFWKISIRYMTG